MKVRIVASQVIQYDKEVEMTEEEYQQLKEHLDENCLEVSELNGEEEYHIINDRLDIYNDIYDVEYEYTDVEITPVKQ